MVVEVPYAVLVEHAVGVVHPAIERGVVVEGTVAFRICRVEGVAVRHLLPACKALYGPVGAKIPVEDDVKAFALTCFVGHIVVYTVDCQAAVQCACQPVVPDDADMGHFCALLYG